MTRKTATLLWLSAALYAIVAISDLLFHPADDKLLTTVGGYLFESLLMPYVLLTLAALWTLHRGHHGRDGRLGRVGIRVAGLGFIAFLAPAAATLGTGKTEALGPVYFAAELLTLVGVTLLGIGIGRAGVLPSWTGILLAGGWMLASPVAAHVTGVTLVGAAAFTMLGATVSRHVSRCSDAPLDATSRIDHTSRVS
ncbi:MAG: hypothetical protein J2P22_01480 [Nocardioides sp.]|nr:hypothetical protein [Nocardioides sp.]